MTGPEHYREAERLLNIATNDHWSRVARTEAVPLAQVHATLALAAANAMNDAEGGMSSEDYNAWCRVSSEIPAAEIPSGGES